MRRIPAFFLASRRKLVFGGHRALTKVPPACNLDLGCLLRMPLSSVGSLGSAAHTEGGTEGTWVKHLSHTVK